MKRYVIRDKIWAIIAAAEVKRSRPWGYTEKYERIWPINNHNLYKSTHVRTHSYASPRYHTTAVTHVAYFTCITETLLLYCCPNSDYQIQGRFGFLCITSALMKRNLQKLQNSCIVVTVMLCHLTAFEGSICLAGEESKQASTVIMSTCLLSY
jgi:acetate kinase